MPPANALRAADRLLEAGRPFEAHEVLEAVWKVSPEADRAFWRGLAQLAVGITHAGRGNETGARALLQRAADTLAPYRGQTHHGVDVDAVTEWAVQAAAQPARSAAPPRLASDPAASGP
jgi:predicted metal-dependent hydrolase